MKKCYFFIYLLLAYFLPLSYFLPLVYAQTDEGYGEDETALGQFVDSFENLNNVSIIYQVARNSTLNAMELNYSGLQKDYENFTEFTLVDTNNKLDLIPDYTIDFIQFRRDDEGYLYQDYGVGYFNDFQIEFSVKINDTEAGDADQRWINAVLTLTNYAGDFGSRPGAYDQASVFIRDDAGNDDNFKFVIWGAEDGVPWAAEDIGKIRAVSENYYYCIFNKTDDDYWLEIYTDSTFSTLDEKLWGNNTNNNDDYQYLYAIQSLDTAGDGEIWMSGDVNNIWWENYTGGYFPDGYFTTDDYMNGTFCNGTSLSLMVNTSIPGNTDIQVQFSNDNATWGDWEGTPLDSNILQGGFESIDLRYLNETDIYLRFNLSTTDFSLTPRIYQARIISTIGNSTGGGAAGPSGSGAIGFIMLILICTPLIILVWGRRKR